MEAALGSREWPIDGIYLTVKAALLVQHQAQRA